MKFFFGKITHVFFFGTRPPGKSVWESIFEGFFFDFEKFFFEIFWAKKGRNDGTRERLE